jgi:hypothetical protein
MPLAPHAIKPLQSDINYLNSLPPAPVVNPPAGGGAINNPINPPLFNQPAPAVGGGGGGGGGGSNTFNSYFSNPLSNGNITDNSQMNKYMLIGGAVLLLVVLLKRH